MLLLIVQLWVMFHCWNRSATMLPKPGTIGAGEFEVGEWAARAVVVEIVIDAQVLLVIQPVVNFDSELVAAYGLGRNGGDQITAVWRSGNKLQQINRGRVHASEGNLAVGENGASGFRALVAPYGAPS